jgi:protoheme IX farnesyltransferase
MQIRSETTTSLASLGRLVRLPLSVMVAVSTLAAALAAAPFSDGMLLWGTSWGIFLLSSACSVLNQLQERTTDALMRRTCRRPLACGALSARAGSWIGLLLASGGLTTLCASSGIIPALTGLFATAWYLLVYTPLKRVTSLAVVAGTPCGALPPLIGWLAVGGDPLDPRLFALVLLMLLWQVPHYWLLALPDRDELQRVGFRVLPPLSTPQLLNVAHIWILGMISATLLLPATGLVQQPLLQGLILGLAASFALWITLTLHRNPLATRITRRVRIALHLHLALALAAILVNSVLIRLSS